MDKRCRTGCLLLHGTWRLWIVAMAGALLRWRRRTTWFALMLDRWWRSSGGQHHLRDSTANLVMNFPMFVLAKCRAITSHVATTARLVSSSSTVPAQFLISWRRWMMTTAHHGVLAQGRKRFFSALTTGFGGQSFCSKSLGWKCPLQFDHSCPSDIVNGLLCFAFDLIDAIFCRLQCLGDQFTCLTTQFRRFVRHLLLMMKRRGRVSSFLLLHLIVVAGPMLQNAQRASRFFHHRQDTVQHLQRETCVLAIHL